MSLAEISRRKEPQAAAYMSDEDEETSVLADLVAMFPNLDHDVIVSVLQAHDGRIQAAVEYLMNGGGDHTHEIGGAARGYLDPARDMMGQFSDDIGGLPEMLPTFLFDRDEERTPSEDSAQFIIDSPTQDERASPLPPQGRAQGFIDEPLPTYDEAVQGSEVPPLRFPPALGDSGTLPVSDFPCESNTNIEPSIPTSSSKKKKKGKKLTEMTSKPKPPKKHSVKLKFKAVRDRYKSDAHGIKSNQQPYQAFISDDELEEELPSP